MENTIEVSFDKLEKLFRQYGIQIPHDVITRLRGKRVTLGQSCFNLQRPSFNVSFLVEQAYRGNDEDKGLLTSLTGVTDLDTIFDINALGIKVHKGYVCSIKDSKLPPDLLDET